MTDADVDVLDSTADRPLPAALHADEILTHPVFRSHHSETAMLRLRRLADKDVALDRSMIPLGSCTMKLNATTEMEPIESWPEFADIHPFAPVEQAMNIEERWGIWRPGWRRSPATPQSVAAERRVTGRAGGLLAISAYHRANGDETRDVT